MSAALDVPPVAAFRAAIARRLGLHLDEAPPETLAALLERRAAQARCPQEIYLQALEHAPTLAECAALAQELTVGETYFFRHVEQFRACAEAALPERMRVAPGPRQLRLLCAGCASGEEAYTLAIVAREAVADPAWSVAIRAVDLNPAALEKAQRGRYSAWALRDTPPEVQSRWFRPDGREMVLDAELRASVTFELGNLAAADAAFWQGGGYDVIFCRNVLMYFTPAQMRAAVAGLAAALAPGGFLFLGHAETLRGLSDAFALRQSHDAFYYMREPGAVPARPAGPPVASDAWFGAIQAASARVAALLPGPLAPAPTSGPTDDPGDLLLEAARLAHAGELDAAEAACARLLAADGASAAAHYVLALCREGRDDPAGAAEHDRAAAHLDPAFAMPRLHLGLLARRRGEPGQARRELRQARVLLEREGAARLELFGGGFDRQALIALCESALRACGAAR